MTTPSKIPFIDSSFIRPEVVNRVFALMARNKIQPHGVAFTYHPKGKKAGHNNSAESWGTGRAKARVPRVKGSGTGRAGQAAVANFARKGHMFSPICVWRRWHRIVPKKERNLALLSALAASTHAPLLQARGHILPEGTQLPIVLSESKLRSYFPKAFSHLPGSSAEADSANRFDSRAAKHLLEDLGLSQELVRCKESKRRNKGRSRLRDRVYKVSRGPLLIHSGRDKEENKKLRRAFGGLPGVEAVSARSLNLLLLAPGGVIGRLVVWTEEALKEVSEKFEKLREKSGLGDFSEKKVLGKKDVLSLLEEAGVKEKLGKEKSLLSKLNGIKK